MGEAWRAAGGWGSAAALSLVVMVTALFAESDRVALPAGVVFIFAAAHALVGHIAGEA